MSKGKKERIQQRREESRVSVSGQADDQQQLAHQDPSNPQGQRAVPGPVDPNGKGQDQRKACQPGKGSDQTDGPVGETDAAQVGGGIAHGGKTTAPV